MKDPNPKEVAERVLVRASAAPDTPMERVGIAPGEGAPLDLTQRWFLDVVAHPGQLSTALRSAGRRHHLAPPVDRPERMSIYHHAYRARLRECLADDFPIVRHALGEAGFAMLADAVITQRPSSGPDLNAYGRALASHLEGPIRLRHRGFLHALARLEWALVEAVHAAPPPLLDPATLAGLDPARLVFTPSATLRILRFEWPVNRYFQAVMDDRDPTIPRRAPAATAVFRRGFTVWRMDLSPPMADLLEALVAGVPMGDALAPLEGLPPERLHRWFSAWVSGGCFQSVHEG